MKIVSLSFLAAFTAWSLAVVGRDMATRKIPNAHIKGGLLLFAGFLGMYLVYTMLGYSGREPVYLNWGFYPMLAAHVFWSALAGIILWYAELWPAGDAKFFILVSASLPLANPALRNFPHYLFLSLLVNIFVAAALWAVGSYVASGFQAASPSYFFAELWGDVKRRLAGLAEGKNKLFAAASVVNMGFVFLLQQIINMEARGLLSRFIGRTDVLFFFLFILWDKIGGVFASRRWFYISAVFYLLYFAGGVFLYPDHLWLMALAALKNVFRFSLLLFFGRFMLEFLMEKKDIQNVTARELEPGMVLSSKAARTLKENPAFEGEFDDGFRDGLTAEQITTLKDWMGKLKVHEPKIEVVRGRPFALWIFAGAVLSLLLDGNITRFFK
jgi:hypothetical protein